VTLFPYTTLFRADDDDDLRVGRRFPRPPERLGHVPRHGAGHEQAVGVARRGDEGEAEALEVVVRARQARDLELTAVARAGVHLADRQRAAEAAPDLVGEACADALDV